MGEIGYHRASAGALWITGHLKCSGKWLGQKLSSHFLFLLLQQHGVRWDMLRPILKLRWTWPFHMFLLLDCTGSATQSSDTRQEDVIELLAKLGGWIHIMTGSVHEESNTQSYKSRGEKLLKIVASAGKTLLCIPSPLAWLRCLTHNICSTCYWLIFLLLIR